WRSLSPDSGVSSQFARRHYHGRNTQRPMYARLLVPVVTSRVVCQVRRGPRVPRASDAACEGLRAGKRRETTRADAAGSAIGYWRYLGGVGMPGGGGSLKQQ